MTSDKPNGSWLVTRTVDASGTLQVSTVGTVDAPNAKAALLIASRLGGVAKFTGTETRGEFRWGSVCYRAIPTRPNTNNKAQRKADDSRRAARLAQFFPNPTH